MKSGFGLPQKLPEKKPLFPFTFSPGKKGGHQKKKTLRKEKREARAATFFLSSSLRKRNKTYQDGGKGAFFACSPRPNRHEEKKIAS